MKRSIPASSDTEIGVLLAGGRFRMLGTSVPVDLYTGVASVMVGVSCVLPEGSIVMRRKSSGLWEPAGVIGERPVRLQGSAGIWVHPDGALTSGAGRELDRAHTTDAWVRFVSKCVTTIVRELAMA